MTSSSLQKLLPSPSSGLPRKRTKASKIGRTHRSAAFLIFGLLAIVRVGAQEASAPPGDGSPVQLDTIKVTARNRTEEAQDVPISVSALDSNSIGTQSLLTTGQFAARLPDVTYFDSNPKQTNISIRGIGKNASNERFETSVGLIVDDVYLDAPGSAASDFVDIDRVEVLRGPQGTLKGKNTTLGVVSITTATPSFTPSSWVQVSGGTKNFLSLQGSTTGPIVDNKLAFKVSVNYREGDGYLENPIKGDTLNNTNRYAANVQLLATPSDTFTVRASLDQSVSNEHTIFNSVFLADPTTYTDGTARPTFSDRIKRAYFQAIYPWSPSQNTYDRFYADNNTGVRTYRTTGAVYLTKELNDWQIYSVSAASHFDFDPGNDSDPYRTHRAGSTENSHQISQEFRVSSPLSGPVDFQSGLYYLKNDYQVRPPYNSPYLADDGALNATNAQYATLYATAAGTQLMQASLNGAVLQAQNNEGSKSIAPYAQANWHITDKLNLTGGLRYTEESRYYNGQTILTTPGQNLAPLAASLGATAAQLSAAQAIQSAVLLPKAYVSGTTSNGALGWLINPSYKVNETTLVYGIVSFGEKSAVISTDNYGNIDVIRPEKALNTEVGIKNTFLNNRIRLNADLFRMHVTDYQTSIRELNLTPGSAPGSYASYDGNVPSTISQGAELDTAYAVTKYLNLNITGTYLDAYYADFKNGPAAPEQDPTTTPYVDYTGKQVAGSSKYSYSVGLDSKIDLGSGRALFGFITNTYRSAYQLSNTLSIYDKQGDVSYYDASVGYSYGKGKYSISLVGKNIFDKKYLVTASDGSAASNGKAGSPGSVFTGSPGPRLSIALVFKALF